MGLDFSNEDKSEVQDVGGVICIMVAELIGLVDLAREGRVVEAFPFLLFSRESALS